MSLLSRFRRSRSDCHEVGRRLQAYLDGELDGVRMDEISAHLDACRDCGLEFTTYLAIKDSLRREAAPLADGVVERLREFGASLHGGGTPPVAAPPD